MDVDRVSAPFSSDQVQAMETIARRVAAEVIAKGIPTGTGRVVSVQADAMRAMVIIRGSQLAVPVKVTGTAHPRAGDRVGLTYLGTEWYITHVLGRVGGPAGGGVSATATTDTHASATPENYPGSPAWSFTKRWDATPLLLFGGISAYNTSAVNTLGCAIGLTDSDGVQTVYNLWSIEGGGALDRYGFSNSRIIPDQTTTDPIPADTYTANLMWYRAAGGGTLNTTANQDWGSGFALELGVWD